MVLLVLVADGLDVQLLALTAPLILKDWGIDRSAFGPAMSAALLGMSVGSGVGGCLGDRVGRKSVLVAATVSFALATALASVTTSVMQMALLRALSGIGFGAALPNAVALAGEWLPERDRARSAGLLSVGVPLGGLIGAGGLIFLLPVVGWQGAFIVCGALTFGLGAVMGVALPESWTFLLSKGRPERAAVLLRSVVGADVVLPGRRALQRPAQSYRSRVWSAENRRLNLGVWLAYFGLTFVAYALVAWSPVLLTGARFTLSRALSASMAFNLMAVLAAVVGGLLISKFGSKRLSITACLAALVFHSHVESLACGSSRAVLGVSPRVDCFRRHWCCDWRGDCGHLRHIDRRVPSGMPRRRDWRRDAGRPHRCHHGHVRGPVPSSA